MFRDSRKVQGPIMQFQKIIWIKECPLRADHAHEHIDPGIRMGDSPVMLSTFAALRVHSAKHLDAHRERPFAAAQGDRAGAIMRPASTLSRSEGSLSMGVEMLRGV